MTNCVEENCFSSFNKIYTFVRPKVRILVRTVCTVRVMDITSIRVTQTGIRSCFRRIQQNCHQPKRWYHLELWEGRNDQGTRNFETSDSIASLFTQYTLRCRVVPWTDPNEWWSNGKNVESKRSIFTEFGSNSVLFCDRMYVSRRRISESRTHNSSSVVTLSQSLSSILDSWCF